MLAGASGAVGAALLPLLLSRYRHICALTRRPLPGCAANLEEVPARFSALDEVLPPSEVPAADVFCALGTTLKRAGSRGAFRKVDFDLVLALGDWAARARANALLS